MNGAQQSISRAPHPTPDALVRLARARLDANEHFARHHESVDVSYDCGRLVLSGRVPSFYLKSVLQSAVGELPAGCRVDNRVHVVNCEGISSPARHAAGEVKP